VVLNQADKGIMQLKETLASLEKQEAQLTKDIDRYVVLATFGEAGGTDARAPRNRFKQKAVEWLRQKNKPKATMELKRKQRLQAALDKRLSFIENIQQILHTIDQTQTDKEVPWPIVRFLLCSLTHMVLNTSPGPRTIQARCVHTEASAGGVWCHSGGCGSGHGRSPGGAA